jgi:hypothetical protein
VKLKFIWKSSFRRVIMGKVVEFPTTEKATSTLLSRLESEAEHLEELYVSLEELHGTLHETELEADRREKMFNTMMNDYAKLVGAENIPHVLLQYCSNAKISANADRLEYILELDSGEQYSLDFLGEDDED